MGYYHAAVWGGRHLPGKNLGSSDPPRGAKMKHTKRTRPALAATSALAALGFSFAASADSLASLVAAAKKEGQLTIIAVPHDWCGIKVHIAQ